MDEPLLKVENATKIFSSGFFYNRKQVIALQDLSFEIPMDKPQIITVAGESGSGKSTLGSLVLGFAALTSGNIFYKGTDISRMGREGKKKLPSGGSGCISRPLRCL